MKKLLLLSAVVMAAVFGACSGKDKAADCKGECSNFAAKIQNCTNPDSLKIYVEEAKAYAQKLVDEGKVDQAKQFLDKVTPVVQEKAPALAPAFETVKSAVAAVGAHEAVDNLKDAASNAVDKVGEDVGNKVDEAKDAVGEKVDQTKEAVGAKVDEAKDAVNGAVATGANEAANAINHAIGR